MPDGKTVATSAKMSPSLKKSNEVIGRILKNYPKASKETLGWSLSAN